MDISSSDGGRFPILNIMLKQGMRCRFVLNPVFAIKVLSLVLTSLDFI